MVRKLCFICKGTTKDPKACTVLRSNAEAEMAAATLQYEHGLDASKLQKGNYLCPEHCPSHLHMCSMIGKDVTQFDTGAGSFVNGCVMGFDLPCLRSKPLGSKQTVERAKLVVEWSSGLKRQLLSHHEVDQAMAMHAALVSEQQSAAKKQKNKMEHRRRASSKAQASRAVDQSSQTPTADDDPGSVMLFDVNRGEPVFVTETPEPRGWCYDKLNEDYFNSRGYTEHKTRGEFFRQQFGFDNWRQAEALFKTSWPDEDPYEHDGCPKKLPPLHQFLFNTWKMRQRPTHLQMASFGEVSEYYITKNVIQKWMPRCEQVGRKLVFIPSSEYILATNPEKYREVGLANNGLIGDCTDILTQSIRDSIGVRNQQWSHKMHHAAARGCSFCTATGFTAAATDLLLAHSSENNICRQIAPKFKQLPSSMSILYDKGVPGMRAYLPNYNNVIVPCFVPSETRRFSVEQAGKNRAVATCRYVIEITYQRVKSWNMLQSVVPEENFQHLNSVWWWALGWSNLMCRFLQPPRAEDDLSD